MTFEEFVSSLAGGAPPDGLAPVLRALWLDGKGDWTAAHAVAQDIATVDGARIHAYLHRKEGDLENAGYWYRRAGRRPIRDSLEEEWTSLVRDLLLAAA